MAKSRYIPEPIRCMLWGRAAGRCEFAGCNQPVSWHRETKETVNIAEAAHIIGFSEDGPRGEEELSEELARDISNLMLLCRNCHKPIDANLALGRTKRSA
jgi:predicted restriction endonuclease